MTSPPFALRRKKSYGNVEEAEYVNWITPFGREVFRVLKETGSFVLDLGGAYGQACRPDHCTTFVFFWPSAMR